MDWDPPSENELRSWRISAWARQRGLQFLTMGTHRVDLVRRQRLTQGGSGTSYSVANTRAGRAVEAASAGTLALQATPRNIFGNGDVTVVLVGAPVANASSVQLLLYQVNGSSGVWLSTNGDESFNATSGRLSLNFLQAGVDRSAIYATSQFDAGLHAWVIRKKPSAHRIWRDGEQQTTTTVSGLAGAPTSAGDTLNILGITTDGSYAAIDPVAMMAVFRGRGLSDSDCIRLSTIGREQVGLLLEPPRRVMWPLSAGATPRSATASLSAAIQASRTATASIAAAVQEQRSAAASAAAAVQQARTTSASVAAAVRQDHTASASIAAAILQARTAAADIAAAVQQGRTASASIAAAVQAARSATASGSAAVQAGASVSASLSAQVQAGSTVAASLDVAVQAARSATAALAGAVQTPRTAQSSIAAAVAAGASVTASLAAAVREARSAGASISAQVQAGTTIVAQIAAAILESKAASAAIAAAVAAARSTSAAIAAAVAQQHTVSATLAAAVRSGRVASAAVSAYISAPGDHTVSPRLYLVDPQDRAYLIDPEDRTYIVPASSRSTTA